MGFRVLPWSGCRDNTVIMDSAREGENTQEGGTRSRKVRFNLLLKRFFGDLLRESAT